MPITDQNILKKPEMKELLEILSGNEAAEMAIQGKYINSKGVLFATNMRLIFIS